MLKRDMGCPNVIWAIRIYREACNWALSMLCPKLHFVSVHLRTEYRRPPHVRLVQKVPTIKLGFCIYNINQQRNFKEYLRIDIYVSIVDDSLRFVTSQLLGPNYTFTWYSCLHSYELYEQRSNSALRSLCGRTILFNDSCRFVAYITLKQQ